MKPNYKIYIYVTVLIVIVSLLIIYAKPFNTKSNGPFDNIDINNIDFGDGAKDYIAKGSEVLKSGEYSYKNLIIESGILTTKEKEDGYLIINASESIVVKKGSVISISESGNNGLKDANIISPKAGLSFDFAGGGGSHGGKGGAGSCNNKEYKNTYGFNNIETSFGMGGGNGIKITDGKGGNGGGYLRLVAPKIIIDGAVVADGGKGDKTGGGGAGGKIVLISKSLQLNGKISAKGGEGGTSQFQGAGGGGGGIAMLFIKIQSKNIDITGGSAGKAIDYYSGCHGEDGFNGKIIFGSD